MIMTPGPVTNHLLISLNYSFEFLAEAMYLLRPAQFKGIGTFKTDTGIIICVLTIESGGSMIIESL